MAHNYMLDEPMEPASAQDLQWWKEELRFLQTDVKGLEADYKQALKEFSVGRKHFAKEIARAEKMIAKLKAKKNG